MGTFQKQVRSLTSTCRPWHTNTHPDTYIINKQINICILKIKKTKLKKNLENPEELNKFLTHMYDIPKLNGEDVTNLNRSITSNTIDAVTRISYPKTPGLERFTDQFC